MLGHQQQWIQRLGLGPPDLAVIHDSDAVRLKVIPTVVYATSELGPAMENAYTQTRKFLMAMYNLTEAEANTIITQGVDFAVTQVVGESCAS